MAKKHWIQNALKHKGIFDKYCKRHGFDGATKECIDYAKKHGDKKTKKRATLSKTLEKLRKKH